jgi:hypothetical protein
MSESVSTSGLVDAALEISGWECDLLRRIRTAFEDGDDDLALQLARELVGLEEMGDETSH